MEWTQSLRVSKYETFMKTFMDLYMLKDTKTGNYKYKNVLDMFKRTELSSGAEGVVYKVWFKGKRSTKKDDDKFIIKQINLKQIKQNKGITRSEMNVTPDEIYNLFYSNKSFNKPSLIEIISATLTNQLVFQEICPNFVINYYWNYSNNVVNLYNEYINLSDFYTWSKQKHSNEIWFNALFQIMYALACLKHHFNMLHTDLHMGNILVQKVQPGGHWIYKLDGVDYYVPNLGYIFLVSDFGFAWIPKKLLIPWYYKDRLKYITKNGLNFYDLSILIDSVKQSKAIPKYFSSELDKLFQPKELLVYPSIYYKDKYNKYKWKRSKSSTKKYFKELYDKYPKDITKSYSGLKNTISDKIYDIFYIGNFTKTKSLDVLDITYSYVIENSYLIETYSLDKPFDKTKLPKNFQTLIK